MKPATFEYHAPTSAEEAVGLLADLDDAKALAGGQSLVPMLALRLAVFENLVDLRRVDELRGIETRDGSVWIGAGTTQATIGRSESIGLNVPLLARATPLIGHLQIRSRGTIGGSIAHADASAEYPAVALALDVELDALSPRGRRTIPAAEFFTGTWSTELEDDELLTGITFPVWQGRAGFAVEEFARRHGDFAMAGACVAVGVGSDGRIDRCAISLFGLGPCARRATEVETELLGTSPADSDADEIGRTAMAGLDSVPTDLHGSASYRKRVGAAMVARAWQRALQEAVGD
ncbi:carbon-monoxide dehydrogenase medium subunit [Parafrankia irregularis]|uniref:Carbon-monoxide dehydrogenase medium subunit n=1 Tax=Parafrankia irregularis TaxID=795642 RepID=A0A0S4QHY1_9ACTN|nr:MULTISPECIES: xanthine dehydrogenase family protein subunit M [Parafrankia]MBE3203954.1 xanthine dehydrogenase family protein subunit M [Parafrankia sp. CH37]CUU55173.1 carbon-monoxide dehydrogenase medium subunit [Parafrankia irregularis]